MHAPPPARWMTHTFEGCGASWIWKSNGVPSLQRAVAHRGSRIAGSTVSHCLASTRTHAETSQPPRSARHALPSFHVPPSSVHAVGVPVSHSSLSSPLPLPHAATQASVHVNLKSRRRGFMSPHHARSAPCCGSVKCRAKLSRNRLRCRATGTTIARKRRALPLERTARRLHFDCPWAPRRDDSAGSSARCGCSASGWGR